MQFFQVAMDSFGAILRPIDGAWRGGQLATGRQLLGFATLRINAKVLKKTIGLNGPIVALRVPCLRSSQKAGHRHSEYSLNLKRISRNGFST